MSFNRAKAPREKKNKTKRTLNRFLPIGYFTNRPALLKRMWSGEFGRFDRARFIVSAGASMSPDTSPAAESQGTE